MHSRVLIVELLLPKLGNRHLYHIQRKIDCRLESMMWTNGPSYYAAALMTKPQLLITKNGLNLMLLVCHRLVANMSVIPEN